MSGMPDFGPGVGRGDIDDAADDDESDDDSGSGGGGGGDGGSTSTRRPAREGLDPGAGAGGGASDTEPEPEPEPDPEPDQPSRPAREGLDPGGGGGQSGDDGDGDGTDISAGDVEGTIGGVADSGMGSVDQGPPTRPAREGLDPGGGAGRQRTELDLTPDRPSRPARQGLDPGGAAENVDVSGQPMAGEGLEHGDTGSEQLTRQAREMERSFLDANPGFDESDVAIVREGNQLRTEITRRGRLGQIRGAREAQTEARAAAAEEFGAQLGTDVGFFDVEERGGRFTLTGEAREEIAERQRQEARESFREQFAEETGLDPGEEFTVEAREITQQDIGRAAAGAAFFDAFVPGTPAQERVEEIQPGTIYQPGLTEEGARELFEEEISEETGQELEAGEHFTVERTDDGGFRAEYTDAGEREIDLQDVPGPLRGFAERVLGPPGTVERGVRGGLAAVADPIVGPPGTVERGVRDTLSPVTDPITGPPGTVERGIRSGIATAASPITGPPGTVERTIVEGSEDLAGWLQEEVVDPAASFAGEQTERALGTPVGLPGSSVESEDGSVPEQVGGATESYAGGLGSAVPFLARGPSTIQSVGETSAQAAGFALTEHPLDTATAAGETSAGVAREVATSTFEEPGFAAGQLVGTGGLFGAARRIGPRTSQATRAAVQPGEELLGRGGAAAFGGAGSAISRAGSRVPGRAGSAVERVGAGTQRAGDVLFPRGEPLFASEEAAMMVAGRAGEAARSGIGQARDVAGRTTVRTRPGLGLGGLEIEVESEDGETESEEGATITGEDIATPEEMGGPASVQIRRETPGFWEMVQANTPLGAEIELGRHQSEVRGERSGYRSPEEVQRLREGEAVRPEDRLLRQELERVEEAQRPFFEAEEDVFGGTARRELALTEDSGIAGEAVVERELSAVDLAQRSEVLAGEDELGRGDVASDTDIGSDIDAAAERDAIAEQEANALALELELEQELEQEQELELEQEQEREQEREQEQEQERELEVELETERETEVESDVLPGDEDEEPGDFGRELGGATLDSDIGPGWFSEYLTAVALGSASPRGDPGEAALEDRPAVEAYTSTLPTEAQVSGTEEEQEAIEEARSTFAFGATGDAGSADDSDPFDFGF